MITSWHGKSRNDSIVYRWGNWTKTSYSRWNNYEVAAESILSLSPLLNYVHFTLPYSFWSWGFGFLIAFNCNLVEKTYLIFFSAYTLRNNFLRNDLVFLVISLISISETQKLNETESNPQFNMKTSTKYYITYVLFLPSCDSYHNLNMGHFLKQLAWTHQNFQYH